MRRLVLLCIICVPVLSTTACGDPIVVLGESPGTVRNVAGIGDSTGNRVDAVATKSRLTLPSSVAFNDGSLKLYFADRGATVSAGGISSPVMRLFSVTSAGALKLELNTGGCTGVGICTGEATDMLFADDHTLIIADAIRHRVTTYDTETHVQTNFAGTGNAANAVEGAVASTSPINAPAGIARSSDGTLYISENISGRVLSVGSNGLYHVLAGGGTQVISSSPIPATGARLGSPVGLAIVDGVLYIADRGQHDVYALNLTTNQIVRFAGTGIASFAGDEGPATQARLNSPRNLAVSVDRSLLYVSDYGNNRVRSINFASGIIRTYMGSGSTIYNGDRQAAGNVSLRSPVGITTSKLGFLFVVDQGHYVIRRVATGF